MSEKMMDNTKILIVDDNKGIHEDFDEILLPKDDVETVEFEDLENVLFEQQAPPPPTYNMLYTILHAYSGEAAIKIVTDSVNKKEPFALAFVDARMPPGINGIETIIKIWELDPNIEIIICTAYSDYSWHEIIVKLGITDKFIILKKPFDVIEAKQLTLALIKKWNLAQKNRELKNKLHKKVESQTSLISSMFDFANKLNSFHSLNDILDTVLVTIIKFINSKRISIMLLDEDEAYLTIKRAVGIPDDVIANTRIKIGDSIAGKVFKLGKPVIVKDIIKEGYTHKYSAYKSFISSPVICSPLIGFRVKLGVINVTNRIDNLPFTDEDIQILSYISYTAAIAINNQLSEMKLEDSFLGTIKALANAIEAKDLYTGGHSERVTSISIAIKNELGLPDENFGYLNYAGILHDIGKIGIPESVLQKNRKLTEAEYKSIQKHPIIGENILKNIKLLEKAREIIRHHHERLDGSGYPDGLKGDQISLGARIVAVADTFDAMNSDRSYRKKKPLDVIIKELKDSAASNKLDRDCVDALIHYLNSNIKEE